MQPDVLIVGAGPAGIATAIACALKGLCVCVLDSRKPPIDKPCGEGLLPEAVAALGVLGIEFDSRIAFAFAGLRFCDRNFSATARINHGLAFGVRRTTLHSLLVDRAIQLGVSFRWGARISKLDSRGVVENGNFISCKWLVGADGQHSIVRKWARMGPARFGHSRFGFRRHYPVRPWTDVVEVHWGNRCQMFVTPIQWNEVCIALLSAEPQMRIDQALNQFPDILGHLRGASPGSTESGAITALGCAHTVSRANVALVGDASCMIDGIAGQGLSLAFQESLHLAEALASERLSDYQRAHRQITQTALCMTRLLLLMARSNWIRHKTLRMFANSPDFYSKLISIHTGESSSTLGLRDVFGLGWRVLSA